MIATTTRIPDDVRDRVRAAFDIVELIGRDIELKRAGAWFVACCPFHDEKTPSFKVNATSQRFKCFGACDVGGDVIDWTMKRRDVSYPEAVRALAAEKGIPVDGAALANLPPAVPIVRARPAPVRAPADEVRAMWEAGVPLADDVKASEWVRSRGLDPAAVPVSVAVALPIGTPCPSWAWCGGTWVEAGYRVLLAAYDATGALVGLRARSVMPGADPKTASQKGVSPAGLVYANLAGLGMLAGLEAPSNVVVVEGEPDMLAAVAFHDIGGDGTAVLGLFSGSWSDDVAARIPDSAVVHVWTHDDDAGNRYAAEVEASVRGRCKVVRGAFPVRAEGASKSADLADLARDGKRLTLAPDLVEKGPSESDAVRSVAEFASVLATSSKPGALDTLARHVEEIRTAFGTPKGVEAWAWADPASLLAEPEPETRWLVRNILATGHLTLLSASAKAGKTSMVTRGMVGPLSRGEAPFCGTVPEEPVTTVWLTEESRRGARNHVRYGGLRGGSVLPRPGPPASVPWPSVVEHAADHARKIGARILCIDPFASHARLKGDEENSSAAVGAAMEPLLRVAATHDLAVLVIHHVKKWATGDPSSIDLARGSGAFGAVVDFFANLVKPAGAKPGQERFRELYGAGRDNVEPYKLTLELVRGDGEAVFDRYRIVGVDEASRDDGLDADIVEIVTAHAAEGLAVKDIQADLGRRKSDIVAAFARLTKGAPPKIRKGKPAAGSKAPRYYPWKAVES